MPRRVAGFAQSCSGSSTLLPLEGPPLTGLDQGSLLQGLFAPSRGEVWDREGPWWPSFSSGPLGNMSPTPTNHLFFLYNSFLVPPDVRLSSYLKYPHPCFFALSEVICAGISSQRTLISAPKIRMLGNRGTVVKFNSPPVFTPLTPRLSSSGPHSPCPGCSTSLPAR